MRWYIKLGLKAIDWIYGWVYNAIDANNDGVIDKNEIEDFATNLKIKLSSIRSQIRRR